VHEGRAFDVGSLAGIALAEAALARAGGDEGPPVEGASGAAR